MTHERAASEEGSAPSGADVPQSASVVVRAFTARSVGKPEERRKRFVASTDALDSYGERVVQNWRLDRFKANPVVLWAHQSRELPIAKGITCEMVDGHLEIEVQFASAKANPKAENVWQLFEEGMLNAVSVGFIPHSYRFVRENDVEVMLLDDNELLELSVTPIPANPDALAKMRTLAQMSVATRDAHGEHMDPTTKKTAAELEAKNVELQTALDAAQKSATEATKAAEEAMAAKGDAETKAAEIASKVKAAETRATEAETKLAALAPPPVIDEASAKAVADATARANVAEAALVERDLNALIGTKILPAEKPGLERLAEIDRPAFDEHIKSIAARPDLRVLGSTLLGTDPTPPLGATEGGGTESSSKALLAAVSEKASQVSSGGDLLAALQQATQ